jgi:hypothetical protein
VQIVYETFLEDVNNILTSGEVSLVIVFWHRLQDVSVSHGCLPEWLCKTLLDCHRSITISNCG